MAYVPYLYYQQVTDNVAIVCAVRLGVELALFGGVLWIQGKAVKGRVVKGRVVKGRVVKGNERA